MRRDMVGLIRDGCVERKIRKKRMEWQVKGNNGE